MKEIEVFDILTLKNNELYTVVSKINRDGKTYAMLVGVDSQENLKCDKVRVVELKNNNSTVGVIKDKDLLQLVTIELSRNLMVELNNI